jgi:hypothetical protein
VGLLRKFSEIIYFPKIYLNDKTLLQPEGAPCVIFQRITMSLGFDWFKSFGAVSASLPW